MVTRHCSSGRGFDLVLSDPALPSLSPTAGWKLVCQAVHDCYSKNMPKGGLRDLSKADTATLLELIRNKSSVRVSNPLSIFLSALRFKKTAVPTGLLPYVTIDDTPAGAQRSADAALEGTIAARFDQLEDRLTSFVNSTNTRFTKMETRMSAFESTLKALKMHKAQSLAPPTSPCMPSLPFATSMAHSSPFLPSQTLFLPSVQLLIGRGKSSALCTRTASRGPTRRTRLPRLPSSSTRPWTSLLTSVQPMQGRR